MIRGDYHTHTRFCDGKNTPLEMAEAAVAQGLTHLGFSAHSFMPFAEDYCLEEARATAYFDTVYALKDQFRDRLTVLCGIEKDLYSSMDTSRCEYLIGSVHYVKQKDAYLVLDLSKEHLKAGVERLFGGDWYALIEAYYASFAALPAMHPSIIGHFDLITKFNQAGDLFDETHPRYLAAAYAAIDTLLPHNIPFEINTGAMSRGYTDHPYPAFPLLEYIGARGGTVILSSDAHSATTLCHEFAQARRLAQTSRCRVVDMPKTV